MTASLTQGLGGFVAAPGFATVPDDVLPTLRNGFIDTLACLLSGLREPVTRAAHQVAASRGPVPQARVLLGRERLSAPDAAFVNAVSAHALDYDDMALNGHPSVVLVPALLAAGEAWGAPDSELLRAYLVGYEVWAELVGREPDSLHNKGWHPTSVLGTVAAAAAVAHLEGLPAAACTHALGIAASLSSGLMGNFGSMTKPLHAGWAASHGIEAVRLARAGATASADIFESATGFLAAFSPQGRANRQAWAPAPELRIRSNGLSVKKYPVCYAGHRVIDGVIALKQAHGFKPQDVLRMVPTLSDVTARVLHAHQPATALQAKFSIEFACAMAACEGAVGLAQVTDAQVARDDIQSLMRHVHAETVPPGCPVEPGFALHDRVRVELRDGSVLDSGPIRFARGHAKLPLSDEDIRTKFMGCADDATREGAQRLLAQLADLGTGRGSSLCAWLHANSLD
ncbi:MmgE/PrpD family protein [uncultured Azohydromonas sp.]|jgi:Uncharacterized protein involved in propionate catabolism|uniref:MmgE/PrpD family protein n=1 Tax=uncultured Azohydromonas sp. TaxID=487342 RepID=UPI002601D99D|nr:MmgE/PrpD family protein [uncultured Azohydromonas sp.]